MGGIACPPLVEEIACLLPWDKPHAQDSWRSGQDLGPLHGNAQLKGAPKGCGTESATYRVSLASDDVLGGHVQQPIAAPSLTPNG